MIIADKLFKSVGSTFIV